jgi:hypothetical protein
MLWPAAMNASTADKNKSEERAKLLCSVFVRQNARAEQKKNTAKNALA